MGGWERGRVICVEQAEDLSSLVFPEKKLQDHEHYLTFPNHFSMMEYIIELLLPIFLICPDFLTISYYLAVSDLWKTCYLYVFRAGRFVR